MSLVSWAPTSSKSIWKVFLKMSFQIPLVLGGAPSVVIVTFTTTAGVGQRDKARPLDFHRFKQCDFFRSAGSFVGISVDNPTPPGQIV